MGMRFEAMIEQVG